MSELRARGAASRCGAIRPTVTLVRRRRRSYSNLGLSVSTAQCPQRRSASPAAPTESGGRSLRLRAWKRDGNGSAVHVLECSRIADSDPASSEAPRRRAGRAGCRVGRRCRQGRRDRSEAQRCNARSEPGHAEQELRAGPREAEGPRAARTAAELAGVRRRLRRFGMPAGGFLFVRRASEPRPRRRERRRTPRRTAAQSCPGRGGSRRLRRLPQAGAGHSLRSAPGRPRATAGAVKVEAPLGFSA